GGAVWPGPTRCRLRAGGGCGRPPASARRVGGRGRGPRRAGTSGTAASVSWPRDDAKLARVRALMDEHDVDALVVRAPDNVLYLANFLPMKGYDVVVFPREGDATLICLEPSLDDARRTA